MTEVDMMFQIAARRIQGLTEKVNHWKRRANELEAALGVEKAARIVPPTHYDELQEELNKERSAHAESCRYLAESEAKAREWGTENKRLRAEVADLEKQRDGFATQVQDMRNEIARLRADLRTMSDRSNGSEWEKKAVELEELRAELNLVKQERDCAKSEWDRAEGRCKTLGGEVAELFSDRQRLKAELAVIKDERNELRAKCDSFTKERDGLMIQSTMSGPTVATSICSCTKCVRSFGQAWSDVPNATQWVEDMRGNTEASHDTPAGKEAAEAVVRDSQMTDTHDCGPNCPHCSW